MPYTTRPEIEVGLINAASSFTVEFLRRGPGSEEKRNTNNNDHFNEHFVAYYFRNVLSALKSSYLDDLLSEESRSDWAERQHDARTR
ncbi:hypothetical protein [Acetobacter senegalensis]|uniref:hypothetical protein n=1 Tax=Acetobacter senegalensis TaxID=446692 RepID=UPI00128CD0DE|nr:hypothetical protein [Acetobacter senegalensis]MPQ72395.1 hypothetical protein [Acetobacter senegalensis]